MNRKTTIFIVKQTFSVHKESFKRSLQWRNSPKNIYYSNNIYNNQERETTCRNPNWSIQLTSLQKSVQRQRRHVETHLRGAGRSPILLTRRRRSRHVARPPPKHEPHSIGDTNRRVSFEFTTKRHVGIDSFFQAHQWLLASLSFVSYSFRAKPTQPFPFKFSLNFADIILGAVLFQPTAIARDNQLNLH